MLALLDSTFGLVVPTPPPIVQHQTQPATTASRLLVAPDDHGIIFPTSLLAADFDLSSLLDTVETAPVTGEARTRTSAAQAAQALREKQEEEARLKAERAAVVIARADKAKEAKEEQAAALKASGVPPCQKGVYGTNTGLLTGSACARERDGMMEARPRTGALLIF